MRILLIEDDNMLAERTCAAMRDAGHDIRHNPDGEGGLDSADSEAFDVIVLDRMLPGLDGLAVLQTLRDRRDTTPVLILSALGDVDERVQGLRAGGDDYLAKPFSMSELLARVDALGRRSPCITQGSRLEIADLEIDLLAGLVRRSGRRIELTSRELRILTYLVRHADHVVTRTMLLEHVWNYRFDPQTNIIDQHVSRLRQKIDRTGNSALIETVRGTGYMIRTRSA